MRLSLREKPDRMLCSLRFHGQEDSSGMEGDQRLPRLDTAAGVERLRAALLAGPWLSMQLCYVK